MSESDKIPPPRRTIAVTVAGVLLVLPAAFSAIWAARIATNSYLQREFADALGPGIAPYGFLLPVGVCVVVALIFGSAGVATVRRWHGWRIWAGAVAWSLIVLAVMPVFSTPPPPGADPSFDLVFSLVIIAYAVFFLVAKRRERRPNLAPVFD